ncbi:MAG: hypothetical protein JWP31_179, partial [Aeromicrobium sp.]|nr:hypothetical protein [Aeromicrobium sp.]
LLCQVSVHVGAGAADMTMSTGMLGAHVSAMVVSVILLARGEAFVWRLAERLGIAATSSIVVAALPHTVAHGPVVAHRARCDVRLTHSRVVRGPPTGS